MQVLGTTISLDHIRDGQATLRVGRETFPCTDGVTVSTGGLRLHCTKVTTDLVEFTATRA
ncbi:hypothetical protein [Blastococcus haudaquaticus]|uniref:hypothetical protein n=1 Tax=Blastococcus haudaquaticus TaxID=1938745 RepID=UPI00117828DD|nr:hypothetical protein [Blastococcus haudaquaticus]